MWLMMRTIGDRARLDLESIVSGSGSSLKMVLVWSFVGLPAVRVGMWEVGNGFWVILVFYEVVVSVISSASSC